MHTAEFYGAGFPYNPLKELEGKLIVLGRNRWCRPFDADTDATPLAGR